MMRVVRRLAQNELLRLAVLVALAAFLADWASKSWALSALDTARPLGALVLEVERNAAFAFSSGSGSVEPWLVGGLRVLAISGIVLLAWRVAPRRRRYAAGFGFLVAGGVGNAADIVLRDGAVVDFIGTGPVTLSFAGAPFHLNLVFNVADLYILLGVALLAPLIRWTALRVQRHIVGWETSLLRRAGLGHPTAVDVPPDRRTPSA
jgi:lipoprotein signal peptidase